MDPQTPNPNNPQTNNPPPLSQDLASLANILTQIQYDLFDINVQLAQPDNPNKPFNSRIDEQAITWIKDLIQKISSQLPQHQDPILPVGNQLACEFYATKSCAQNALTETALFYEQRPNLKPKNYQQLTEYLRNLTTLMFIVFRWSNLVMGEKEWFWKTKDQMKQQAQQPDPSPQPDQPFAPSISSSSLPTN